MGSVNVERQLAQDREVLGSIVFPRPVPVLGEVDIERPMKPVLDAPVTACDVQEALGRHVFGQQIMAYERRIGRMTALASARGDPADRNDAGESVNRGQTGIAHDCRSSQFAPIVTRRLDLLGTAALAGTGKLLCDSP